ncbi:MAG: HAMP domain-containing protein [Ignavibacteria bacterium]
MQKKTNTSAALQQIPLTAKKKSSAAKNGDFDKEELLKTLLALKNGNFSFRLQDNRIGVTGKIYNIINEIANLNSKTIADFKKAEDAIGKKGQLNERLEVPDERGQWTTGIKSINALISNLVHPTIEIANVISDVAKGNLSVKMPLIIEGKPLKGEFNKIAREVNDMVKQLNLFSMEVTRVAREVGSEGKLGEQAKLKGVGGVW